MIVTVSQQLRQTRDQHTMHSELWTADEYNQCPESIFFIQIHQQNCSDAAHSLTVTKTLCVCEEGGGEEEGRGGVSIKVTGE